MEVNHPFVINLLDNVDVNIIEVDFDVINVHQEHMGILMLVNHVNVQMMEQLVQNVILNQVNVHVNQVLLDNYVIVVLVLNTVLSLIVQHVVHVLPIGIQLSMVLLVKFKHQLIVLIQLKFVNLNP
jgi:hypothetical protein